MIRIHDNTPEPLSGEYGTIMLPHASHVLSLLFFAAALRARFLTVSIAQELLVGLIWRPALTARRLCAMLGLYRSETRGAAKIALFLNVTVLLGGRALWPFFWILPG